MIRTSCRLKALVRNMSKGNNTKALIIIRNYAMERFLERLSVSKYRNNFILKGGVLVAAMVGIDNRSTLDVDVTIKNLALSEESARKIVRDITDIRLDDEMAFEIKSVGLIMDDAEYPGIRVTLETTLETMRIPLKIDFSIGDIITPGEVSYSFKLLFEERTISILAYNLETLLAEKLETMLTRGTTNTRMRDFYDIFVLENTQWNNIDKAVLKLAFANTSKNRGSGVVVAEMDTILSEIGSSLDMIGLWVGYQHKFEYAADITWDDVMQAARRLCDEIR